MAFHDPTFEDEFVPNIEGRPDHARWIKSNPKEAAKWAAYREAVIDFVGGKPKPTQPVLATKYGKALVAAGKQHVSVTDIGSAYTPEEPPPPPPPPPPVTVTDTINGPEDMYFNFNPANHNPFQLGGTGGGGITQLSTPYGSGWKIVVTDQMESIWDFQNGTHTKCCLNIPNEARFYGQLGKREEWLFYMYFPSGQTIPDESTWMGGELWQWHTSKSSGHHLCLNWDGKFRIGRMSSVTGFQFVTTPMSVYTMMNRWIPVTWDIKWSQGSDGWLKMTLDGVTYFNYTGPTDFNDGARKLQFGWYADRVYTNEVRFSPMSLTRS